jgi:hypothetical protein
MTAPGIPALQAGEDVNVCFVQSSSITRLLPRRSRAVHVQGYHLWS